MKRREISATGTINNDGRLVMFMGELNEFFARYKGCRVVARFEVAPAGSSAALRGYYYNYLVPTMREAFWETGERLTEEQTERRLRTLSPVMWGEAVDPDTGIYTTCLRDIHEVDKSELVEHIETLKQFAAENLNVYIEDPRTI